MTKITDKPFLEACANGDGTINGRLMIKWLLEATTKKTPTDEDVQWIIDEAKRRSEKRKNVRPAGD